MPQVAREVHRVQLVVDELADVPRQVVVTARRTRVQGFRITLIHGGLVTVFTGSCHYSPGLGWIRARESQNNLIMQHCRRATQLKR